MSMNPYEVLGVARNASDEDIKKAYHKLVMKHHPDKNQGDKKSEEKFKEINNAFDVLKDSQKRAAYDRFGSAAFNNRGGGGGGSPFGSGEFHFNMGGGGMEDVLREAMKGFGFGDGFGGASGQSQANRAGRDLLDEVNISLRDAYFGKTHTVKFSSNVKCVKCDGHGTENGKEAPMCNTCNGNGVIRTRQGIFAMDVPCPDCNGLGKRIKKKCSDCDGVGVVNKQRNLEVKIPAGIQDGTRLRLQEQGEAGQMGAATGDFYLDVRVMSDKKYHRFGNDLLVKEDVPFELLALGGQIEVETIDDKKLEVKISSGTQIGEKLRMRGYGMPTGRTDSFGDLYVEVMTEVPKKLSEEQKKALEEYSKAKPIKKGWF